MNIGLNLSICGAIAVLPSGDDGILRPTGGQLDATTPATAADLDDNVTQPTITTEGTQAEYDPEGVFNPGSEAELDFTPPATPIAAITCWVLCKSSLPAGAVIGPFLFRNGEYFSNPDANREVGDSWQWLSFTYPEFVIGPFEFETLQLGMYVNSTSVEGPPASGGGNLLIECVYLEVE